MPPPRRSASAAGAPPERKMVRPLMKRRSVGRPPRATALALLGCLRLLHARGMPACAPSLVSGLRLLRARGMPAWAPSMLGGIRIRRGRGRLEDRMGVDPQPRRGDDRGVGNPHGRGGQGYRRPPAGGVGGGRDPPARREDDAPPDADRPHGEDDAPPEAPADNDLEGVGKPDDEYILDASEWIGIIDKDDLMGLKDAHVIYQPFFAAVGLNQDDPKVVDINKLLFGVYSEMVGTYMDIYVASAKKWGLKRNSDELPWDLVKEMVQDLDQDLKVSFTRYNASEKYSVALMEKIQKLDAEPLQRPLILQKGPSRFDFKKERKAILKQLRKEEKIKIKKREKKLKKGEGSSSKKKGEGSSSKKKAEGKKKGEGSSSKKKGEGSSSSKKKGEGSSSSKKKGEGSSSNKKKGEGSVSKRKESHGKNDSGKRSRS